MSFSTLVCVIYFAGGLLFITSLPLLPKARGFLLMAIGVALASLAMAHWTIAPSYPAFGIATREAAPYGLGLAGGLLLAAIVVWGIHPDEAHAARLLAQARRIAASRSVRVSPSSRA